MFTKSVVLKYQCSNCKRLETLKKYVRKSTIEDIVSYALNTDDGRHGSLKCYYCYTTKPMQLIDISCELLNTFDEFGINTENGITTGLNCKWVCENSEDHIGDRNAIYPLPLKRAYEGKLHPIGSYDDVIKRGYPWRCPICDGKLYLK